MMPRRFPVKRTALGRLSHEASTVVRNKDGRIVVYMGDDDYFEYVYRFVSDAVYDPANPASAKDILDAGTLSVARYDADGSMTWMPLVQGQGPLTAENGFCHAGRCAAEDPACRRCAGGHPDGPPRRHGDEPGNRPCLCRDDEEQEDDG